MVTMLNRGLSMWARNLAAAASVTTITVTRGAGNFTLTDAAWVGVQQSRLQADGGARIEWSERDYMIPATAYNFGNGTVEPEEHDRITETINGVACTFRIVPPQGGEKAWRWCDPSRTTLRVHTKQVA